MNNLQWIKQGDKYLLKNEDQLLVELALQYSANAVFMIGNRKYTIARKGYWSPVYKITHNGENILTLSYSFWGSHGRIIFQDGSVFGTDYKTKNGLQLRFMDNEQEILSYGTSIINCTPVKNFHVGIAMEDAEKLLVLAALGMTIFTPLFNEMSESDDSILVMI